MIEEFLLPQRHGDSLATMQILGCPFLPFADKARQRIRILPAMELRQQGHGAYGLNESTTDEEQLGIRSPCLYAGSVYAASPDRTRCLASVRGDRTLRSGGRELHHWAFLRQ